MAMHSVNNASGTALGAGTYTIIQQTSGNITSSGSYTVTITGVGLFGNATATIQVNGGNANLVVAKATPTFSGLAASQSINYGTTSVILGGKISAGSACPPNGETIMVTINGNTQNTTINDSTGDFSINYNPVTIPYSASAYTITYSYGGDASFNSASDSSTALTVNKAAPTLTAPSATAITYGQTLASSTLSGGTATNANNNISVAGSFAI